MTPTNTFCSCLLCFVFVFVFLPFLIGIGGNAGPLGGEINLGWDFALMQFGVASCFDLILGLDSIGAAFALMKFGIELRRA